MRLRLGTRGSALAVAQSTAVADELRALGHDVELVVVTTRGDRDRSSLTALAGAGVFAAELRAALLAGGCDFAVHSLKDLPVAPVPGLVVAAVPRREDPDDVLCTLGAGLADLPPGARIGTGSPRRVAQLRALRPDCVFVDIRGNIGTRLGRVAPGDLDGVVLAAAGLNRLGRSPRGEALVLLPAPAQGALALECREDDVAVRAVLGQLEHPASRAAAEAERAVLAELGGGCAAPIGARAEVSSDGTLRITAGVFAVDGGAQVTASDAGPVDEAGEIGRRLARRLLADGAAAVTPLAATRPSRLVEFHDDAVAVTAPGSLAGRTVLVPRAEGPLADGLRAAGAAVWCEPLWRRVDLDVGPDADTGGLPPADWTIITSAATVESLEARGWRIPAGSRIAAVGPATAAALEAAGYGVDLVPRGRSSAEELLRVWPAGTGTVLVPGSVLSGPELALGLRDRGWDVVVLPLYSPEPVAPSRDLRAAWQAGDVAGVLVTSGSVARSIDAGLGWPERLRVVALGEPTARALDALGVSCAVARTQDAAGVVAAFRELFGKR